METKSVYSAGPLDRNVMRLAALFVQPDGCYAGLPGVDAWPEHRDARLYRGPMPVVAHRDAFVCFFNEFCDRFRHTVSAWLGFLSGNREGIRPKTLSPDYPTVDFNPGRLPREGLSQDPTHNQRKSVYQKGLSESIEKGGGIRPINP